jgi:hypothetical protein
MRYPNVIWRPFRRGSNLREATKNKRALGRCCRIVLALSGYHSSARRLPNRAAEVRIETRHREILDLSDVTVAELTRAAKERNSPLRHPILGAYSRSIGITLNFDDVIADVAGDRRCAIPKLVHFEFSWPTVPSTCLGNSPTLPACSSWCEDTTKSTLKPTMPRSIAWP